MGRIDIETEESPNCDCHPMQTFETLAPERQVTELWISGVPGRVRAFVVVGWCIEAGNEQGGPCTLTVVEVTDSGAAVLLLAAGGDYGLRVKPENTGGSSLDAADQWGRAVHAARSGFPCSRDRRLTQGSVHGTSRCAGLKKQKVILTATPEGKSTTFGCERENATVVPRRSRLNPVSAIPRLRLWIPRREHRSGATGVRADRPLLAKQSSDRILVSRRGGPDHSGDTGGGQSDKTPSRHALLFRLDLFLQLTHPD
ncbi:MAG: hypothetical protein CL724_04030 [Chloroflexi bacterium]|jgi:hypothetical protein|nr:hypothetical protein [Chloroflexota bacterium]|tara:strand:- start:1102 stop:1869 length:768 start_codon:yes stop_codon:yes gene_type:complete